MPGDEDEERRLLSEARVSGDGFAEFHKRTRDDLLAWLYAQTYDAEVAADLASETHAAALVRVGRFESQQSSTR